VSDSIQIALSNLFFSTLLPGKIIQQEYATFNWLKLLEIANGCKKDPLYNKIPTFAVTC
jgi:hypothetical protein